MNNDDTPTPSKGTQSREWFEANLPGEDGLEITAGLPPTHTPRTDAAAWQEDRAYVEPCELVKADFARTLERELAAAQAELAALRAAQEWRPIEEAPRDGTRFLAVTANGFYDVIYYSKRTRDFVGKWSPFVSWMPLPPPPKGGES